jgi:hypothetical protein
MTNLRFWIRRNLIITPLIVLLVITAACSSGESPGGGAEQPSGEKVLAGQPRDLGKASDSASDKAVADAGGYIMSIEAGDHLGETGTVRGHVKDYQYHDGKKGKPTVLLFDQEGVVERGSSVSDMETPDTFTVVVMRKDKPKFPPHYYRLYRGKYLCVTGSIVEYDGRPSMIIADPAAIIENC